MSRPTGIIFVDVARDIGRKLNGHVDNKKATFIILILMVLTGFSTMNFISHAPDSPFTNHVPVNPAPPSTGNDNIYINGSVFRTSTILLASGTISMSATASTISAGSGTLNSSHQSASISWSTSGIVALYYSWSASSALGNWITSSLSTGTYTSSLPTSTTFNFNLGQDSIPHTLSYSYSVTGYHAPSPVTKSWGVPNNVNYEMFLWSYSATLGTSVSASLPYGNIGTANSVTFTYDSYGSASISFSVTGYSSGVVSTFASGAIPITITQNQNWWNSSFVKYNVSSSTGESISYTVDHVLSMGYQTGTGFDVINYNGTVSGSVNVTSQYSKLYLSAPGGQQTYISFASHELINYSPSIVTHAITFSGSGSTALLSIKATEVIPAEEQNFYVSWGDSHYNVTSPSTGQWLNITHQYDNTGNYTVEITVYNEPNAAEGSLSSYYTLSYSITMNTVFTPQSGVILYSQNTVAIVVSTDGNVRISNVSLLVNGQMEYPQFSYSGNVLTSSYTLLGAGTVTYTLVWTLRGGGITQSYTVYYFSPKNPGEYANWIGMSYNTTNGGVIPTQVTEIVPINITNSYNTASAKDAVVGLQIAWKYLKSYVNANVSNVEIVNSTFSPLYAWMQAGNYNTTSYSDIYVNLSKTIVAPHATTTLYILIYNKTADLLEKNNYWGEAPYLSSPYGAYDNGAHVFPYYWNFVGNVLPSGLSVGTTYYKSSATGGTYTVANGITFSESNSYTYFVSAPTTLSSPYQVESIFYTTGGTYANASAVYAQAQPFSSKGSNATFQSDEVYLGSSSEVDSGSVKNATLYNNYQSTSSTSGGGYEVLKILVNGTTDSGTTGVSDTTTKQLNSSFTGWLFYGPYTFTPESLTYGDYIGAGLIPIGGSTPILLDSLYAFVPFIPIAGDSILNGTIGHVANPGSYEVLRYYSNNPLPDPLDMALADYVYTLYKSLSAPVVYIYYNSSWALQSISTSYYTVNSSLDQIEVTDLAGISAIQIAFLEPASIANPYSNVVLNIIPSIAVGQLAGVTLPSSYLEVYVNGQELYSNNFQAVIGQTYQIKVESAFLTTLLTENITPTLTNYPVQLYVNMSSITWSNQLQATAVLVYVIQNGYEQGIATVNPQSTTLPYYFPSGQYTFVFDYYNYTTKGNISLGLNLVNVRRTTMNVSGLMTQVFFGLNLLALDQELNTTAQDLYNSISNVYVNLYAQGGNINNLTLAVMLQLSLMNSSIGNMLTQILLNQSVLESIINSDNISEYTKLDVINSLISSENINQTNEYVAIRSVLNSTTVSLSNKVSFVDSLLNSTSVSIETKISFVDSLLNSTALSINTKLNFISSLLNNTNLSIQNKLSFINSIINGMNVSLSSQITFIDNLINQTGYVNAQYPITISNPPSGTGYYQQLFTIGSASKPFFKYGINSKVSNFEFQTTSGTKLYAWIQSYNSTSIQVWVKMPNGTTQIYLEVYSKSENLLSANGYLGYSTEYYNIPEVFNGTTFPGKSLPNGWVAEPAFSGSVNNGVTLSSSNGWEGTIYLPIQNSTHIIAFPIFKGIAAWSGEGLAVFFSQGTGVTNSEGMYPAYVSEFGYSGNGIYNNTIQESGSSGLVASSSFAYIYYAPEVQYDGIFTYSNSVLMMQTNGSSSITYSNTAYKNFTYLGLGVYGNHEILVSGFYYDVYNSMPTFTIGSPTYSNSSLYISISNAINLINSTLDSVNFNLTTKIAFIDSLLNNTNLSIQTKLTAINSLLDNVNLSIKTRLVFLDSLLNNTNISLQNQLTIINSLVSNVNLNLTTKITFVDSLLNNTNLSIQTKLTAINSLLNNVNLSIKNRITFLDSLLNNTNISIQNKLTTINSIVTDVNLNLTSKVSFVDSLLNNTNISLSTKLTTINTLLKNVNVNVTNKISFVDSLLNDTNISIQTKLTAINSLLNTVNLNVTNKIKFVDSLLNNTNISLQDHLSIINSLVTHTNLTLSSKVDFLDSLLNNTNISIQSKLNLINTLLNNVNLSVKNKISFVDSLLNNTNISLQNQLTIINSLVTHSNLTLVSKVNFLDSLLNNTNVSIQNKLALINSLLNNVNISVKNRISFLDSLLNNTNISIQNQLTVINSLIKYTNVTVTSKIDFVDSLLNSTGISIDNKISFVDALMNNTNISIQNKLNVIDSFLGSVNVSLQDKLTLMSDTIHTFQSNVTLWENVANDTINTIKKYSTEINQNLTLTNTTMTTLETISKQNFTGISSNIKNDYDSLFTNITFLNSTLKVLKGNFTTFLSFFNSTIGKVDTNITTEISYVLSNISSSSTSIITRETTIKDLVSMSLQEENSTFSYKLSFGTPSVSGEIYRFPVFVTLFNGQMANLSVTQQAWQNMKLYYVTGNQTYPLDFSASQVQAGSFLLTIYNITPAMAASVSSDNALITAQGEVKAGSLTNLAAGIIGSQQIQYSSSNIWKDIFGVNPPNSNNSIAGIFGYLSWLDESYAGRAIYMIVIFFALMYYIVMINLKLEQRRKKK